MNCVEVHSKTEMLNAVSFIDINNDPLCIINMRKNGRRTTFNFPNNQRGIEREKHIRKLLTGVRKTPAHIWK